MRLVPLGETSTEIGVGETEEEEKRERRANMVLASGEEREKDPCQIRAGKAIGLRVKRY